MRRLWLIVLATLVLGGCGVAGRSGSRQATQAAAPGTVSVPQAHPHAVEPVAGGAAPVASASSGSGSVSIGTGSGALAQPVSNAQVRQELAASGISANPSQAAMTPGGLAVAPIDAPATVQTVISAGNEIARLPYRFGGGHGTFVDSAYDCSGSLSFVFAAAGILNHSETSGELMKWGDPGPGKWITVFAAQGHTFMYIAGLRFDTVALAQSGSRWSNQPANESNLGRFVARHPPGL